MSEKDNFVDNGSLQTGRIHSIMSMGGVDGPGIRCVVFLQGCSVGCAYCHNPDTWTREGGDLMSSDEVAQKVLRYRTYFGKNGGLTVSGGEPLMQAAFVSELFGLMKKEGISTCLDTSGHGCTGEKLAALLKNTDITLCDIKFTSQEDYKRYSNGSLDVVKNFLEEASKAHVRIWIRHVVIPGITENEEGIKRLVRIAECYEGVERIELLPFHKMCIPKYEALGIPFQLADVPECTGKRIKELQMLIPEKYAGG
ncbi:MAG: pyruvate formate lyase-activating protein [Lachnospiraceae bacterium]|nr:pyruvate formate lyase-activating protein [Lachnospiraceae bacterium]